MDAPTRFSERLICPCCHQDVPESVEKPMLWEDVGVFIFRGERARLGFIETAIVSKLMAKWPQPVRVDELARIWGALDVDVHNNMQQYLRRVRSKIRHMGLTIQNVRSNTSKHLFGGYWLSWGPGDGTEDANVWYEEK